MLDVSRPSKTPALTARPGSPWARRPREHTVRPGRRPRRCRCRRLRGTPGRGCRRSSCAAAAGRGRWPRCRRSAWHGGDRSRRWPPHRIGDVVGVHVHLADTLRAARPMVWIRLRVERRKPSLSASRIDTSDTSGRSRPSPSSFMPTSTSYSPSRSCAAAPRRSVSTSECRYRTGCPAPADSR